MQSLVQITVDIIKNNKNRPLTAREISSIIVEKYTEFCTSKMKNTKANTKELLVSQIRAEIGAHAPSLAKHRIYRTADKPKKYYYAEDENNTKTHKEIHKNKQEEKELYPKLAEFCNSKGIKTLRIDEKTSKKDGGKKHNIWLHADVVGYEDLTKDFNKETKECLIQYSSERSFLYSFEVKDGIISNSNIREYFFQAVSNSSWANYSYLVAEGLEEKAKEELQLLCSSFKLGFIQINREEPLESDIVIQAPKTDLDWKMINRISVENPDFREYLKNISLAYKKHSNSDIKSPLWDIDKIKR